MTTFDDQLSRLRAHVVAQRPLPLDLGRWAMDELGKIAGTTELRMRRNFHLYNAGAYVGGSVRHRAIGIIRESIALDRMPRFRSLDPGAVTPLRVEVHAARLIAPIPAERQLRTILADAENLRSELAVPTIPIANTSISTYERGNQYQPPT